MALIAPDSFNPGQRRPAQNHGCMHYAAGVARRVCKRSLCIQGPRDYAARVGHRVHNAYEGQ
ncbi:hypothetical protein IG631_05412 [Alternaria alternata]|nr:hypothetical protein IG631_05412 [Alternaria alternata]